MPVLRVKFLGEYALCLQDEAQASIQPLPTPPTIKSQSLLAYIIIRRDIQQSRERLIDLFWRDHPERKARRSLSTALWHIRRCFPSGDPIQGYTQTFGFAFPGDLWLDVEAFETHAASDALPDLQAAVDLYRGDFLVDFYDDWAVNERYRLQSIYHETLAKLMMFQETAGNYHTALELAQRLLAGNALREDGHRVVMRASCFLGQRNTALAQYYRCRQTLQDELGVDPMPETTELFAAIQEGRFAVEPVSATSPAVPTIARPTPVGLNPLAIAARTTLVGRKRECASLNERWVMAQGGKGNLVLVGGEAGVGKTSLLEAFTYELRAQGFQVLWGRCYEFERRLPYQPIAEALRPSLLALAEPNLKRLPAWVLTELRRLLPEMLSRHSGSEPPVVAVSGQEQTHLFAGVVDYLSTLAASGAMMLVLEDLHWATESTLELLHYLARHLPAVPVLLLGSFRSDAIGPQHPLRAFRQHLQKDGLAQTLALAPLSSQTVEEWVLAMSGSDASILPLAQRLYQETEGNPFFLVETIKALFESGEIRLEQGIWQSNYERVSRGELPLPASIGEVIRARIRRLDTTTQEALTVAAVLGVDFDFDLLAAVWDQGEENVLDALDQLLRHQIVVDGHGVSDRDYVFTHHKIQEVVYTDTSRPRRHYLHARTGHALEILYGPQISEFAGELAFHFLQGKYVSQSVVEKAVHYLLLAGDKALSIYANQDAIHYFEQAVSLLQERGDDERAAEMLLKLGQIYHTELDFQQSQQAYEAGFALRQQYTMRQHSDTQHKAPHPLRVDWCGLRQQPVDLTLAEGLNWNGVVEQLFSGLVALDAKMDIVPDVAHRWEILADGKQYIFHLRDDVFWSDGVQVRAIDFVYALRRMLNPVVDSPFAGLFFDIRGARAFYNGEEATPEHLGVQERDPFTLVIELEQPTGHMLHLLAQSAAFPIPHHIWDAHGPAWIDAAHIVTNGPFRLQSWDPGCQMTLVLNPAYHGYISGNVDQVELIWCDDERSRLEMYTAGELDILDLGRLPADEMERARRQYPDEYVSEPWPSTNYAGFNTAAPPFDDVRVRRAFTHVIDRKMLAHDVLNGFEFPALGGFIPPGMPGHSARIGLPYDPDYARQLLHQAGYPKGQGLPPIVLYSSTSFTAHATYLGAQWEADLGAEVIIRIVMSSDLANHLSADQPYVLILGWLADYPDPDNFLRLGLQRYATGWQHPAFSDLVKRARRIADHTERQAMYVQADDILVKEAPILPLTYWPLHLLVKPWVRHYPTSAGKFWFWKDTLLDPH